ncbi:MAG: hypothetical protein AAB407_04080 [Patescibacteria group bacterium]
MVKNNKTMDRLELSIVVHDNETFDSLVAAGNYEWKAPWITAERFPVRSTLADERKLVLLHFNRQISSENAINEAENQGLTRPTYEDALRFGAQHPEVQREFPIIFLHEPVRGDDGRPSVLCLDRLLGARRDLLYTWSGYYWGDFYRFAFVYKPA